MPDKETPKTAKAVSKSFMTVGPTLHYSHSNVIRCWLLATAAFTLTCLFWSKVVTGSLWTFDFREVAAIDLWHLDRIVISGASIFEYPWQILVLGLLMGVLAVVPVLMSQLMSFAYSVPFVLAIFFVANLPAFAVAVAAGSVAAACRPLRFRSRFIAIALCMAPQLFYWCCFGSAPGAEPVRWGFSFAPWVCAWIGALAVAAVVLGIGHYTRYRPGLVWITTLSFLAIAFSVFETKIGFSELDYQLYVAGNNPQNVREFQDHGITGYLDQTITNPSPRVKKYIDSPFYPREPIQLREALKQNIEERLSRWQWPGWFPAAEDLGFESKRQWLFDQYDIFIKRRPKSGRMPTALYYKALLSEYACDLNALRQSELLRFYSDYPFESSQELWYWLYSEFGDSPESLEARWRIAVHLAGDEKFAEAAEVLDEARAGVRSRLQRLNQRQEEPPDTFTSLFRPPPDSAITALKLTELQRRLNQTCGLISARNRGGDKNSYSRLARFVLLNPHDPDFSGDLDELLSQMKEDDPLRDNVLLAKIKLVADEQLRAERLSRLHGDFMHSDGGMQALYELGLLKMQQWQRCDQSEPEARKEALRQARAVLREFLELYPDSACAEGVRKNFEDLPEVE
jgi:hypothetical protein